MLSKNPTSQTTFTAQRLAEPTPLSITLRLPPAKVRALARVEKYNMSETPYLRKNKNQIIKTQGLNPTIKTYPRQPRIYPSATNRFLRLYIALYLKIQRIQSRQILYRKLKYFPPDTRGQPQ